MSIKVVEDNGNVYVSFSTKGQPGRPALVLIEESKCEELDLDSVPDHFLFLNENENADRSVIKQAI